MFSLETTSPNYFYIIQIKYVSSSLIKIRCLLYLFFVVISLAIHPVWRHVRDHIFYRPISNESTKSFGIEVLHMIGWAKDDPKQDVVRC